MRKFELEELVAEQEEIMEKVYDLLLDGDPEEAQAILAESLELEEPDDGDDEGDDAGEGGEAGEEG